MPSVTIEYMIMIPVLILQIFLFPITAQVIMNTWTDSSMTLELQETAGHMGSSIQQLYYTMNHASVPNGTMSITLDIPPLIEGHAYNTTLSHAKNLDTLIQVMNVTLTLLGTNDQTSTLVTLGQNVDWQENLTFNSTAHSLSIVAHKMSNSISLSFGGA